MEWIIIILQLVILGILIKYLIMINRDDVVIKPGRHLIFKDVDDEDWVIAKSEKKLITGVKQGRIILKKSTI